MQKPVTSNITSPGLAAQPGTRTISRVASSAVQPERLWAFLLDIVKLFLVLALVLVLGLVIASAFTSVIPSVSAVPILENGSDPMSFSGEEALEVIQGTVWGVILDQEGVVMEVTPVTVWDLIHPEMGLPNQNHVQS